MERGKKQNNIAAFLTKLFKKPQMSITSALMVLLIFLSLASDKFFTPGNFINVIRQASTLLIVAGGMTLVLIIGGIDLSVGSVAGLAGMLVASFLGRYHWPVFSAIAAGVCIGIGVGFLNGIITAFLKIAPFIVTLASMSAMRGLLLLYCDGRTITGISEDALYFGRGYLWSIPVPAIFMVAVIVFVWILLNKTKFGRYMYAIGGNEECARLSGVNVRWTQVSVYVISGACAALTGILLTLRVASGQPTLGEGMELDAIAATVLGGTSLSGGKGYMMGTVVGCLFLTFLSNGLNILGVSSFWKQVLTGAILILAVVLHRKK